MPKSLQPHLLFRLLGTFSPRRKKQFVAVLLLMLLGAGAEMVSIAAVLPFLQLAADPGRLASLGPVAQLADTLGIGGPRQLLLASALILIGAAILSAGLRVLLTGVTYKFTFLLAHDLGRAVFSRTIRQPYSFYVQRNSAQVLSGMDKVNSIATGVLVPLLQAVSSTVIAIAIIALLIAIDPLTAITAGAVMALVYVVLGLLSRSSLIGMSRRFAELGTRRTKTIQESLGGIRDIILDQSHAAFERQFEQLDREFRMTGARISFLVMSPRYVVEGAGIVMIALLALYFTGQPGGVVAAIPVLGALALGAQRLLPLLQNVNVSWTQYLSSVGTIEDVIALLEGPRLPQPATGTAPLPFHDRIELLDVGYHYSSGTRALEGIDLVIPRGSRLGLVGKTGSGKSTLADLLMGLLQPTSGEMRVDSARIDADTVAAWQAQIAHVPQAIFLADDSIAANIAFGLEAPVDLDRVWEAAERADLRSFIEQLPEGMETRVGERGVRLSGGQRQRIGIARALYRNATVLILDEATSALDDRTEAAVMQSVESLGRELTVILIAHRLSTVASCDMVCRLEGGRIVQKGSYEDVVLGGRSRRSGQG